MSFHVNINTLLKLETETAQMESHKVKFIIKIIIQKLLKENWNSYDFFKQKYSNLQDLFKENVEMDF